MHFLTSETRDVDKEGGTHLRLRTNAYIRKVVSPDRETVFVCRQK